MNAPQPTHSALDQLTRLAAQQEENGRTTEAARLYHQAARQAMAVADFTQATALVERAVLLAADHRPAERFALLFDREFLYGLLGRRSAQLRDLSSLEALAEALNDDSRRAIVAARQAEWRAAAGDPGMALSLATLALRLAQLSGAGAAAAAAHHTLGHVLISQAQYDRAVFHLQKAMEMATELGDNQLKAEALRHLGVVANDREHFEGALVYYTQAAALYAGAGDRRGQAQVLNNRGHVHGHRGQLGQARQSWLEAETLFRRLNDLPGSIRVLINLGALHIDLGRYEEAEQHLTRALVQAEEIDLVPGIGFAALNLGLVAQRQGRYPVAVERLQQAHAIARKMGAQRLEGAVQTVMGHALAGMNELAAAGDAYWTALSIWEALDLPNLATEARAGLARIAQANNAPTLALGFVNTILEQVARDGSLEGVESPAQIFLTCYHILTKANDGRAAGVLRQGHAVLAARLASIEDQTAQEAMRQNIGSHRDLLALMAQQN